MSDFLKTDRGQETLDKCLGFINNRADKGGKYGALMYGAKMVVALTAVSGGVWLSYSGKFDSSIAVLLGSVVGYILGGNRQD